MAPVPKKPNKNQVKQVKQQWHAKMCKSAVSARLGEKFRFAFLGKAAPSKLSIKFKAKAL